MKAFGPQNESLFWQGATGGRVQLDLRIGVKAISIALLCSLVGWLAQPFGETGSLATTVEGLAKREGMIGGVIAYGVPGDEPVVEAFGLADRSEVRPMSTGDRFKIASLSKPVTATAILSLMQRQGFDLETKLVDLLPTTRHAQDPRTATITIRHLLQHSAGWDHTATFDPLFIDAERMQTLLGGDRAPPKSCDAIAEAMLALPLQFDPGSRYAYSNLGYCWLGRILARHGGGSYADAISRLVPSAAGFSLDAADISVPPEITAIEAPFAANDPSVVGAAGGWITDARRYFAFASKPIDPKVVERPAFAGKDNFYGLGWRVWDFPDGLVLSHFGALPGASSLVIRKLDGPLLVALFNGRPADPKAVFERMIRTMIGKLNDYRPRSAGSST